MENHLTYYTEDQIDKIFDLLWADRSIPNGSYKIDEEANLWAYSAFFTATIRNYGINPNEKTREQFNKVIENLEWYLVRDREDYLLYASENGEEKPAFFDDNAWLVLGFIHAYQLTNEEEYLNKALKIQEYLYYGWAREGGLYWREFWSMNMPKDTYTRNTCITGPTIMAAALLYEMTEDEKHLEWATKIYKWTREELRAENYLYNDHINHAGEIGDTKYTYNQGTMVSSGVYLYRITGEKEYLEDAKNTANAAFDLLALKNDDGAFYQDLTWFRVYMYLGHYDLYRETGAGKEILDSLRDGLIYAWETKKDWKGLLSDEWWSDTSNNNEHRQFELLNQAGTAECLAVLAQY